VEAVAPGSILWETEYTHPVFSPETARAQKELAILNQDGPVYFCGSYFRYGFHEDAFASALELCTALTAEPAGI
jgi:predicted NAD/FAD-binding protein